MAQEVERILGKDEVTSSTLVSSSKKKDTMKIVSFLFVFVSARTQHRLRVYSQHHLSEG